MTRSQIQVIQDTIGVEADGFWGPKSIAACQRHLRALMPSPNPWPQSDQKSLTGFYGLPGDESHHTRINVTGLGVKYSGKTVNAILCHKKVAESLLRVIKNLTRTHPEILAQFDGCYNNRPMRGGTSPSLHARAAAVDFASGTNGLNTHWPTRATMPFEVLETFAREGWLPAAVFWSRDAMHFQATQ